MQDAENYNGNGKPRVFVYGTLKRGQSNHGLLAGGGAVFLGEHRVTGPYRMVDFGWYPGVVRADGEGDMEVAGEVFEVDEETLFSLDLLEGHPTFYQRFKVETPWKRAWMYILPSEYLDADAEIVESGEWHGR